MGEHVTGALVRTATIGDADSLDAMLEGVQFIVNCAGPFLDTASPLVEAALRARVHYLDLTAETEGEVRGPGVWSAGAAFDAADFLQALAPDAFVLELPKFR